jgi:hypothetical protein
MSNVLEKQNTFHIFLKYTETKWRTTASSGHQVAINEEEAHKKMTECIKIPETRNLEQFLYEEDTSCRKKNEANDAMTRDGRCSVTVNTANQSYCSTGWW